MVILGVLSNILVTFEQILCLQYKLQQDVQYHCGPTVWHAWAIFEKWYHLKSFIITRHTCWKKKKLSRTYGAILSFDCFIQVSFKLTQQILMYTFFTIITPPTAGLWGLSFVLIRQTTDELWHFAQTSKTKWLPVVTNGSKMVTYIKNPWITLCYEWPEIMHSKFGDDWSYPLGQIHSSTIAIKGKICTQVVRAM